MYLQPEARSSRRTVSVAPPAPLSDKPRMLLLAAALAAATPATPRPPAQAGECKWVHGRFNVWNGSSIRRIWVIGTRRMIALRDDDEPVPREVARYENDSLVYGDREQHGLYGNFFVCARERSRPGHLQHVRLLGTRNLVYLGKPFPG
ncbi:MAG: hypothetical protein QOG84_832 [Sphingomonadales bacterium]|nr:hypothetical protein [Sphingomonadales bacterium]